MANIKGLHSHSIIDDAYTVLRSMDHRGACGADENSGDGAGILTALPHQFLQRVVEEEIGTHLPETGGYGAGTIFLPQVAEERERCKQIVESIVVDQGQTVIGWRAVPTCADAAEIGRTARLSEPYIEQLFIGAKSLVDRDAFERKLYLIQKQASHRLRTDAAMEQAHMFYICSLSTRVMIYKGMLRTLQLMDYFPDLGAPDYTSHLAMVHSRFSTARSMTSGLA